MSPIEGVRYACSVCKNFNFCAECEDRVKHEHHFLKIRPTDDGLEEPEQISYQDKDLPGRDPGMRDFDQLVSNFKEKCGI